MLHSFLVHFLCLPRIIKLPKIFTKHPVNFFVRIKMTVLHSAHVAIEG
jgi:hypothetical protein